MDVFMPLRTWMCMQRSAANPFGNAAQVAAYKAQYGYDRGMSAAIKNDQASALP